MQQHQSSSKKEKPPRNTPGSIHLCSVSKSFRRRSLKSYTTLKSRFLQSFQKPSEDQLIHALKEVSVEVKPGTALGVIGRNGSGKSTFLKLVAGIYQPDIGKVSVNGRISALIELGAGFHPDFTGRENVYLGGVMFGLTRKEIDQRFDDIVAYAELEKFIDDPVRTYSSGMFMRLGFSLAVHTDPDILLIDEVLAVGDAAFVHRCRETISEFKRQGKTLLFVAHDLDAVERWCDEVIWLAHGVVAEQGEPKKVIGSYLQSVEAKEKAALEVENEEIATPEEVVVPEQLEEVKPQEERWGNGEVEIVGVRIFDEKDQPTWLLHAFESMRIEVRYRINKPVEDLVFGIGILRLDGVNVLGTNTDIESIEAPLPDDALPAYGTFSFSIERLGLIDGSYYLDVAAHKSDGTPYDYHHRQYKFSVRNQVSYHGVYIPVHEWSFSPEYQRLRRVS